MADPITLGAGAMVVGGTAMKFMGAESEAEGYGIQATGARVQAQAEYNMYTYKAGVALLNKQISDMNADYAIAVGESKAQQAGIKSRYDLGMIRVAQGASGLSMSSGTAQ